MPPPENINKSRPKRQPAKDPLAYIGPEPKAQRGSTKSRLRRQMDAETEKYRQRLQSRQDVQTHLRSVPESPPPQPFVPSPPDTEGMFIKPWQRPRQPTEAELSDWNSRPFSNPKAMARMNQAREIGQLVMKSPDAFNPDELAMMQAWLESMNTPDGSKAIDAANAILEMFNNSSMSMQRITN